MVVVMVMLRMVIMFLQDLFLLICLFILYNLLDMLGDKPFKSLFDLLFDGYFSI